MKQIFSIVLLFQFAILFAQNPTAKKAFLNESTIVKTTEGIIYPYSIWQQLLQTGNFSLRPEEPDNEKTAYIIYPLTEKEKEKRLSSMPKPNESKFFTTGKLFGKFKTTDMYGKKVNTSELIGKTVVLNFWFINCPPCRSEIPHLNKLVEKYKENKNIVFIAVALDEASEIETFLKNIPFNYQIIDKGRWLASNYSITSYPTNVVIDKEGIVRFHSTGYSLQLPFWIEKTIEEIK